MPSPILISLIQWIVSTRFEHTSLLIKEIKLAEFGSTGQLLISKFHQLSAGNSGSGCGMAPPRAESIAHAGRIELVRNIINVTSAIMDEQLRDKRPNRRLFMPTSAN